MRTCTVVKALVTVWAIAVAGLVAVAAPLPQTAPTLDRTPLVEWFGPLAEQGGRWIADNPAYTPGAKAPKAFAYAYAWLLDGWILENRIIGVFEKGEIIYWHTRFTWDPVRKAVRIHQAGWDGAFATGEMRRVADGRFEADLRLVGPDGAVTEYRDTTAFVDPNHFVDTSAEPRDGKWVEQLRLEFRRRAAGTSAALALPAYR
jgi:hypothetical protein